MRIPSLIPAALAVSLILLSCGRKVTTNSENPPAIFPDYIGVTVPESMAGLLRFRMADGRKMSFTQERVKDTLFFRVKTRDTVYAPFPVYISHDEIDPYIAYRLIEPNYESWKYLGIYARQLSSFREKAIVTNKSNGGGCLNCHHFPGGDPSSMMFHARGRGGGTVFKDGDRIRLLNLTTVGPHRQGTYPAWHPSGRYIAFSSNTTQQSFPITGSQPVEVFDTASDLILFDLQTDSVTTYAPVFSEEEMETFPAWSPDGSILYYCSAPQIPDVGKNRAGVRYALKAVDFKDGAFCGVPRTVFSCDTLSVSFPRIFGKWLVFTAAAYGTFPIWHREADLWLLDLESGNVRKLEEIDSPDTESYHSWSSNGRWMLFSSRRLDGRYTRLFLAHSDGNGHFDKPFLLPQKDPDHNILRLTSYNIPEFVKGDPGNLDRQVSALFGL